MKYLSVIFFAAVCYARPEAGYDYTPHQNHQQHSPAPAPSVEVTKHVYVHVPPNDPQEQFASPPAPAPPVQKHYKIIFIKAPSYPTAQEQFASPPVPQTEEKTIVYVLVKKPDDNLNVDSAPLPQKPHHPPEVYFIKYKSNEQKHQQQSAQPPSSAYGVPAPAPSPSQNFGAPGHHQQSHNNHHGHNNPAPTRPADNYGPPALPNLPDNSYIPPHHKK
uniref:CSON003626 protein n=1 Tax=Culicoides sonorensis TaxID=179676 RepID=A0A336MZS7_CULSO